MRKKSIGSKIGTLVFIIIVMIVLKAIYEIYKENYFNDFVKAEYILNVSEFKRDNQVKYNEYDSYRITSPEYNDAMFYKTISVIPNTPYRVSCMIRTEGVVPQKETSLAGAGICIMDTTECSPTITGTTEDWTKVEFLFDSKNRTEVSIGFRLGAYNDNCKGTAWFSNLTLEAGAKKEDTHWNMACFVMKNLDINVEIEGRQEHIVQTVSQDEIENLRENLNRFQATMKEISNEQMTISYDIIEITEPVTDVTYEVENGYYLSPANVSNLIEPYIVGSNYDYIYVVARFGNLLHNDLENKNDWVGLRGDGLFRYRIFKYSLVKR